MQRKRIQYPSLINYILLSLAGGVFLFGLFTLDRFPPVNFDEIGNIVLAHSLMENGQINYPLMSKVVDPKFVDLTSSGQGSLRGPYVALLGVLNMIFHENIYFLRLISFFIWAAIGVLIYILLNRELSTGAGRIGVLIWLFSLDGVLASRLVRPDIILGALVLILVVGVSYFGIDRPSISYGAGFLAGISFGIHPHGLLILVGSFLGVMYKTKPPRVFRFGIGILAGLFVWIVLSDFETFALSKFGYAAQYYRENSGIYYDRLMPWTLLGDAAIILINPQSFYLDNHLQIPGLWLSGGIATHFLYLFSFAWCVARNEKNRFLILSCLGFLFCYLRDRIS